MKSIVKKISSALQVILMAPVKLPAKIAGIVKYLALGLGIVESVLDGDEKPDSEVTKESPKLVEDRTDKDQQPDQAALEEESTMPENNTDRDPQIKKTKLSEESALLEETSELHDPGKEVRHADQ